MLVLDAARGFGSRDDANTVSKHNAAFAKRKRELPGGAFSKAHARTLSRDHVIFLLALSRSCYCAVHACSSVTGLPVFPGDGRAPDESGRQHQSSA